MALCLKLLALAEYVDKLHAICMVCGKPGTRTRGWLMVNPDYNDPIILIGAKERYEARCRLHHEVINKPGQDVLKCQGIWVYEDPIIKLY